METLNKAYFYLKGDKEYSFIFESSNQNCEEVAERMFYLLKTPKNKLKDCERGLVKWYEKRHPFLDDYIIFPRYNLKLVLTKGGWDIKKYKL